MFSICNANMSAYFAFSFRNTKEIKIAVENAMFTEKICAAHFFLKYAKNAAIAYSHKTKTEMPS